MKLIDTHAHLGVEYFPGDEAREALVRARAAGVVAVLDVGTRIADSREALERARCEPDVFATAGIHPHEANDLDAAARVELERLAGDPRVVAIGECGLDYHYDHSPRDTQREALRFHLRLARRAGKPLVIHNRQSDEDLLRLLEEERAGEVGGVLHAFAAGDEAARRALDLGFHLGFGGMITFKNADSVRSALRLCPLDRLLLETDAPYLTPVPFRGQRNEPARVRLVAERAAQELGVDAATVAQRSTENARALFRLPAW